MDVAEEIFRMSCDVLGIEVSLENICRKFNCDYIKLDSFFNEMRKSAIFWAYCLVKGDRFLILIHSSGEILLYAARDGNESAFYKGFGSIPKNIEEEAKKIIKGCKKVYYLKKVKFEDILESPYWPLIKEIYNIRC